MLGRADALEPAHAEAVAAARFVYLVGDNPMHLRSVLKDSPVWDALVAAWQSGAVVAAVGGASRVLCDPMVDPRGGAFAVGLGLLPGMALIPHHEHWSPERAQRAPFRSSRPCARRVRMATAEKQDWAYGSDSPYGERCTRSGASPPDGGAAAGAAAPVSRGWLFSRLRPIEALGQNPIGALGQNPIEALGQSPSARACSLRRRGGKKSRGDGWVSVAPACWLRLLPR